MNKNTFLTATLTCILALLTGCATTAQVQTVEIPIPIPCNIVAPDKPAMPWTDAVVTDDVFNEVKKALAEIEVRKGYETKLEASILSCNSK